VYLVGVDWKQPTPTKEKTPHVILSLQDYMFFGSFVKLVYIHADKLR
jgi:hypothetical protein